MKIPSRLSPVRRNCYSFSSGLVHTEMVIVLLYSKAVSFIEIAQFAFVSSTIVSLTVTEKKKLPSKSLLHTLRISVSFVGQIMHNTGFVIFLISLHISMHLCYNTPFLHGPLDRCLSFLLFRLFIHDRNCASV